MSIPTDKELEKVAWSCIAPGEPIDFGEDGAFTAYCPEEQLRRIASALRTVRDEAYKLGEKNGYAYGKVDPDMWVGIKKELDEASVSTGATWYGDTEELHHGGCCCKRCLSIRNQRSKS